MSQLARRENAPHRAAFVTSLSRWYIRRLLGNLPPFHPSLSAERRPRIVPCGTSPPYGHTPRKSRHGKPFLPSSQCIRNWSGFWENQQSQTIVVVSCAAFSLGTRLARTWTTRSKAITILSRRTRTVSLGSSSARPLPGRLADNLFLQRQIWESAVGQMDRQSPVGVLEDKHIRQYKAQGGHGFPSAKPEMIQESLEVGFQLIERQKKH